MKKRIIKTAALMLAFLVFAVGGYVGYVVLDYNRIEDDLELVVESNKANQLEKGRAYSVSTFNVGFGAYDHDFSFFMDTGEMKDGTKCKGTQAKAKSKEIVLKNTAGAIEASKALNADFMLFQETDIKATRSHNVNQYAQMQTAFLDYSSSFAVNFDSSYLLYPINDPIGKSKSGLATFSKYSVSGAMRKSLPISSGFAKFFDLDRCISISRVKVSGAELVLINAHLSAFDEGGLIRVEQLELLNQILSSERAKGNYVVVGGDFNHDLIQSHEVFVTEQKKPNWIFDFNADELPEGFSVAASLNAPTCRSTDIAYTKGVNYTVVIDGFIISDNVRVLSVENIDLNFENSDHNPVLMMFELL